MKQAKFLSVALIVLASLFLVSCKDVLEETCRKNGTGKLTATNKSLTGQAYKILVNGINFGTVYPGDTGSWDMPAGPHAVVMLIAATGRNACTPAVVHVVECESHGISCSK